VAVNHRDKHNQEADELRRLLQDTVPPVGEARSRRDLWPLVVRRIEQASMRVAPRVPWFDWALLGAAAAALLLFPALLPALLYHL